MTLSHTVCALLVVAFILVPAMSCAQEKLNRPYFVTYDHYLEERDSLEIATAPVLGRDDAINSFWGGWTEFEYGVRQWWTTTLYLDWQHTRHEKSAFTGLRFENRLRLFREEHRINPVIYIEYEHLDEADKTIKEVVGFDGTAQLSEPLSETRKEHKREIETRLILSSQIGQWNIAQNFIGEKGLTGGQWEFGYAVGFWRPLAPATGRRCAFCAESFAAGAEFYGGSGDWSNFTLTGTSHYAAPVIAWTLPSETTIRVSPGWGLTSDSVQTLFRIGVSQELDNVSHWIGKAFRRN